MTDPNAPPVNLPYVLRLALVSTSRSDYGHIKPLFDAAKKDLRFWPTLLTAANHTARGSGIAHLEDCSYGCSGVASEEVNLYLQGLKTDVVVVQGDRTELLGVVEPVVRRGLVLAHCGGGELTAGSTDDRVRDAITALAHLHYPGTKQATDRLVTRSGLGVPPWRVLCVGEIGLDEIWNYRPYTGAMDYVDETMVLFVINPVTVGTDTWSGAMPEPGKPDPFKSHDDGSTETKALVQMVVDYVQSLVEGKGGFALLSEANGDRGGDYINATFKNLAEAYPVVCRYMGGSHTPTLEQFREIVHRCGLVVGNSSMCLIEVPVLGKPVILVGTRQQGRPVPNGVGVLDVCAATPGFIKERIGRGQFCGDVNKGLVRDTTYGDGHACEKILDHIYKNWNNIGIRGRA